ncbi:MAG: RNase P modulator RnpM [Eubacteriales bacterium]
MKKIPERSCVVCGEKITKRELNRIVRNKEGDIFYDPTGKANGRGAYICSKEACIDAIVKKSVLNKAFKSEIDDGIKEKIRDEVMHGKK